MHEYSEDVLVEQPTIDLFAALGYETANGFYEKLGKNGTFGRETYGEVVLLPRLRAALQRLNPGLAWEAIEIASEELTRDRSALSLANANREVYRLLKNGVNIRIRGDGDEEIDETERVIEWKKISNEQEKGVVSLETMIRGTCEQGRLLDIVENFTLFSDAGGAGVKLIAKNHQFLGVNNALDAVHSIRENQGRLGVFWHTQGSGKSYSMVFFSQKVLRKIPGNWTFLIVTDRQELDDQIYKTFQDVGAVTERQVQAENGEHLQQLLQEDHRNIFTLIHKFHTEKGQTYSKLSDRSDIIVITDEAHRTQYDILALNMRNALPNAAFIGFTGTPLMAGEEKTREVFGDYVSVYNFSQSVDDGTTVPLYYEKSHPRIAAHQHRLQRRYGAAHR